MRVEAVEIDQEMAMGVFYNFVVNDPVLRLIIDKISLKNQLMLDFEQFMLEYQTQFVHFINNLFDIYQYNLPDDLTNFEYDYLSSFFRDLSFFFQNDYLPSKKTWFTEEWHRSLN